MPVYFFWGDDDFRLQRAVRQLCDRTVDPAWVSFNFDKIGPEVPNGAMMALNQAMTPPFGMGRRLVWLQDTSLGQRCDEGLLKELERTLPNVPEAAVLLLTSAQKPDGRLRSTKLLQKHGTFEEFSAIPPWKADLLVKQVHQLAGEVGLKLTVAAAEALAAAAGNNTRQVVNDLEKLKLFWGDRPDPLSAEAVGTLVVANAQSSLQLATAVREGDGNQALALVTALVHRNEPALRIVATLVGQFRTWLWVKAMVESGERDERTIAQAAEVGNPKRIYFLRKEVQSLSLAKLQQAMALLLTLEFQLKHGADDLAVLQTKVIELSQLFRAGPA